MKKTMLTVVALSSAALLSSCSVDSADYSSSYVGSDYEAPRYIVGYGDYNVSNGYGPVFWNPGYFNYIGYNRGYLGRSYSGEYFDRYGVSHTGGYVCHTRHRR